jgi:chorismate dehydratase
MTVRIGHVRFFNTLPLVQGLEASRDVQLVPAVPSALAGMLQRGEVDVALASVVDAARSPVPLALLDAGGIGSEGQVLTVRVFSRVEPARISALHADTDSHTSVILARVLLAERFGARPAVHALDAGADLRAPNAPASVLLIGDKVVQSPPDAGAYPHQLDLGEQWGLLTGLPFVYAAWMCRAADADRAPIRAAASLLARTRLRNAQRLDWLIDLAVTQRAWPRELAQTYVRQHLRYEIGPEQRAGVERFLSLAHGHGLLPAHAPTWVSVEQ